MTLKEAVESAVRGYLTRLYSETNGNIVKMCRVAKISRQTMYRYLHRAGVIAITMRKGSYGRNGKWGKPTLRIGEP